MTRTLLLLGVVGLVSLPALVFADAGDLDPTFGTDGIVTSEVAGHRSAAFAVAVQPDGKIIVAGRVEGEDEPLGQADVSDFALRRYESDGSLDPSFGDGGLVRTDFGFQSQDSVSAVLVMPDGRIVAGGSANRDMGLARYLPDGTLDTTFGSGGRVAVDMEPGGTDDIDWVSDLALQPDGKIVAVGLAGFAGGGYDFGVLRLEANGQLDLSFGGSGKVTTDFHGLFDGAEGVALQEDGKIIVGGRTTTSYTLGPPVQVEAAFALARYLADGTLDSTFGGEGDGRVSDNFTGTWEQAFDVALGSDGRIVVAGQSGGGPDGWHASDFALARYEPDGSPDLTFGQGGFSVADLDVLDFGYSLALQGDGRAVLAGWTAPGWQGTTAVEMESDFALLRVDVDGNVDDRFGAGGWVKTGGGVSTWERAYGLALQKDGRILAVGPTATGGPYWTGVPSRFLVARYDGVGDPAEAIGDLKDGVDALIDRGTLNRGQGQALLVKLDVALARLESGQDVVAAHLLQAFVQQLEDLVATGVLAAAEGTPLIDWARVVIAAIEGP